MNRLASLATFLFMLAPATTLAQQAPGGTGSTGTDTQLAPPPPGDTGNAGDDEYAPPPAQGQAAPTTPPPATPPATYTPPPAAPAPAPAPTTAPATDNTGMFAGMTAAERQELLDAHRRRKQHVLYIEATGGVHWLDMVTVSSSNFLPPTTSQTTGTGGDGGLAAGVRLANFIGIGARANFGIYPGFNFGQLAGEIALYLPTEVVEPFVRVGFGYAWVGNANIRDLSMGSSATTTTTIYGFTFMSSIGLDIFLGDAISIGAAFDFDVLNLARQKEAMDVIHSTDVDLTKDGNAVGLHIGGHAQITLHFL